MRIVWFFILGLLLVGSFQVWSFDYPSFEAYKLEFPFGNDPLRNTSRLTDVALRYGFEHFLEWKMAKMLDRDGDGLADFTGICICEFLERMKIILSDRRPFEYVFRRAWTSLEGEWQFPSLESRLLDI